MAYFGVILILVLLGLALYFGVVAKLATKNPTVADQKMIGSRSRAIRQLDLVTKDPMLTYDPQWQEETDTLIKEYYGR